MKKVILINGSPQKNQYTHKLLMEAEPGAVGRRLVYSYDRDIIRWLIGHGHS